MAQMVGALLTVAFVVFGVALVISLGGFGLVVWLLCLCLVVALYRLLLHHVGNPMDVYAIERRPRSFRRR